MDRCSSIVDDDTYLFHYLAPISSIVRTLVRTVRTTDS